MKLAQLTPPTAALCRTGSACGALPTPPACPSPTSKPGAISPSPTGTGTLYFGGRPRLFGSTMSLTFAPILDFEGVYAVARCGTVVRLVGPYCTEQRPVTQYVDHRGYARLKLSRPGKISTHAVHRLVAAAFLGAPSEGMTVNHIDGNKLNNDVSNLEYCTRLENTRHAVSIGRISLSGAKITREIAEDIRRRYSRKRGSSKALAAEFGITQRTVCRIVSGELWHHPINADRIRSATPCL